MLIREHIKALALATLLAAVSITEVRAGELTPAERNICSTLQLCVDIMRRHTAEQFDYDVLEREFRRFGPAGRSALFDLLGSKAGSADIGQILSRMGPVSADEKAKIKGDWSIEKADAYLPLLKDGHVLSRDLLLLTLGHANANVREQARMALIALPDTVKQRSVSPSLAEPLLRVLKQDEFVEVAPYLKRLNAGESRDDFVRLLRSPEEEIVSAAYSALYRDDPSKAFNALLIEMDNLNSTAQSRAIGNMLLKRHARRADGFYIKFSNEISGDPDRSLPARASGLHAVLSAQSGPSPEWTPARLQALEFLVSQEPFVTQNQYLPKLGQAKSQAALSVVWSIAQKEKWINRDRISSVFKTTPRYSQIISDLLKSSDVRSVAFGLREANAEHREIIRSNKTHPVKAIADMALKALKQPLTPPVARPCVISNFDSNDQLNQLPFFDPAWSKLYDQTRVIWSRKYLTSAHPTATGWLAGYSFEGSPTSVLNGGVLVHYDNKSGRFERIGTFTHPVAILPNRTLKLGEVTNRFWIIDRWGGDLNEVSAYSLNLSPRGPILSHLGVLPPEAEGFTVAPNGDLLMRFETKGQAPIRMSPRGEISLACRAPQPVNGAAAAN